MTAGIPSLHHLEDVMGTIVPIDVWTTGGRADASLSRQLTEARTLLQRADEVFSTWKPDSPVSRLRRGEITSAQAPAEVGEVLGLCAIARELSGGWFDPWAMPGGVDARFGGRFPLCHSGNPKPSNPPAAATLTGPRPQMSAAGGRRRRFKSFLKNDLQLILCFIWTSASSL